MYVSEILKEYTYKVMGKFIHEWSETNQEIVRVSSNSSCSHQQVNKKYDVYYYIIVFIN